jgi:SAM-dependent methyltransferase
MIDLFSGLDRLAPGSAESLRWVLGTAGTPGDGAVLDAGCGTGADLGILQAALPKGRITAIDTAEPFVARVKARFPRIEAYVADMSAPPGGPFDLIWSGGAAYSIGVKKALELWRPHLVPGGRIAFSDLCWRTPTPPEEARAFWAADGVTPLTAEALETVVAQAGYTVLGARWLGTPGWASYYGPLEGELDTTEADPDLVAHLRAEIALWRTHGVSYGYRIVVCAPTA